MDQILNILGSVGFNWHVAFANFVNFLIILFLLKFFFFEKIKKTINERNSIIETGLVNAKEAELHLRNAEEEKRHILKEAYKEREEIINKSHKEGEQIIISRKDEFEKEAKNIRSRLEQERNELSASIEKSFREKAPILVAELYKKTIESSLSKEGNDSLIASMKA